MRVCRELGFELISFVQPAPASHLCLQPVGKQFCFLFSPFFFCFFFFVFLFKRAEEGREKMTNAQEDQLGSGPGAAQ